MPLKEYRRQVQMVFQDSYASLNPRLTVEASVAFGPGVHGVGRGEATRRARDLLERLSQPHLHDPQLPERRRHGDRWALRLLGAGGLA